MEKSYTRSISQEVMDNVIQSDADNNITVLQHGNILRKGSKIGLSDLTADYKRSIEKKLKILSLLKDKQHLRKEGSNLIITDFLEKLCIASQEFSIEIDGIQNNNKMYCILCSRISRAITSLTDHFIRKHNLGKIFFPSSECVLCKHIPGSRNKIEVFIEKSVYLDHIRDYHDIWLQNCVQYDKILFRDLLYDMQINEHLISKPYLCNQLDLLIIVNENLSLAIKGFSTRTMFTSRLFFGSTNDIFSCPLQQICNCQLEFNGFNYIDHSYNFHRNTLALEFSDIHHMLTISRHYDRLLYLNKRRASILINEKRISVLFKNFYTRHILKFIVCNDCGRYVDRQKPHKFCTRDEINPHIQLISHLTDYNEYCSLLMFSFNTIDPLNHIFNDVSVYRRFPRLFIVDASAKAAVELDIISEIGKDKKIKYHDGLNKVAYIFSVFRIVQGHNLRRFYLFNLFDELSHHIVVKFIDEVIKQLGSIEYGFDIESDERKKFIFEKLRAWKNLSLKFYLYFYMNDYEIKHIKTKILKSIVELNVIPLLRLPRDTLFFRNKQLKAVPYLLTNDRKLDYLDIGSNYDIKLHNEVKKLGICAYELECVENLNNERYIAYLFEQFELKQLTFSNKYSVNIRENDISAKELIEELKTPLESNIIKELEGLIEMDSSSHRNWLGKNIAILRENYIPVMQITFSCNLLRKSVVTNVKCTEGGEHLFYYNRCIKDFVNTIEKFVDLFLKFNKNESGRNSFDVNIFDSEFQYTLAYNFECNDVITALLTLFLPDRHNHNKIITPVLINEGNCKGFTDNENVKLQDRLEYNVKYVDSFITNEYPVDNPKLNHIIFCNQIFETNNNGEGIPSTELDLTTLLAQNNEVVNRISDNVSNVVANYIPFILYLVRNPMDAQIVTPEYFSNYLLTFIDNTHHIDNILRKLTPKRKDDITKLMDKNDLQFAAKTKTQYRKKNIAMHKQYERHKEARQSAPLNYSQKLFIINGYKQYKSSFKFRSLFIGPWQKISNVIKPDSQIKKLLQNNADSNIDITELINIDIRYLYYNRPTCYEHYSLFLYAKTMKIRNSPKDDKYDDFEHDMLGYKVERITDPNEFFLLKTFPPIDCDNANDFTVYYLLLFWPHRLDNWMANTADNVSAAVQFFNNNLFPSINPEIYELITQAHVNSTFSSAVFQILSEKSKEMYLQKMEAYNMIFALKNDTGISCDKADEYIKKFNDLLDTMKNTKMNPARCSNETDNSARSRRIYEAISEAVANRESDFVDGIDHNTINTVLRSLKENEDINTFIYKWVETENLSDVLLKWYNVESIEKISGNESMMNNIAEIDNLQTDKVRLYHEAKVKNRILRTLICKSLKNQQRYIFEHIEETIDEYYYNKVFMREFDKSCIINGEAGSGKTKLIIYAIIYLDYLGFKCKFLSFTARSAIVIDDMLKETIQEIDKNIHNLNLDIDFLVEDHFVNITDTIHSFFGIDYNNCSKIANSPTLTKRIKQFDVIFIDEYSMLGNKLFKAIGKTLSGVSCASGMNNVKYFGKFLVILTGDFMQIPPVADEPILKIENIFFRDYFKYKFNLTENIRASCEYLRSLCKKLRTVSIVGLDTDEKKKVVQNLVKTFIEMHLKNRYNDELRSLSIVFTNKNSKSINLNVMNKYFSSKAKHLNYNFSFHDTDNNVLQQLRIQNGYHPNDDSTDSELIKKILEDDSSFEKNYKVDLSMKFATRSRILFLSNVNKYSKFVNGNYFTIAEIEGDDSINSLVLEDTNGKTTRYVPNSKVAELEVRVPSGTARVKIWFYNWCIRPYYSLTAHKCQGSTLNKISIYLTPSELPLKYKTMLYTIVTRVRKLEDIAVREIDIEHLTAYIENMEDCNTDLQKYFIDVDQLIDKKQVIPKISEVCNSSKNKNPTSQDIIPEAPLQSQLSIIEESIDFNCDKNKFYSFCEDLLEKSLSTSSGGLRNPKNVCFANAAVQVFVRNPEFVYKAQIFNVVLDLFLATIGYIRDGRLDNIYVFLLSMIREGKLDINKNEIGYIAETNIENIIKKIKEDDFSIVYEYICDEFIDKKNFLHFTSRNMCCNCGHTVSHTTPFLFVYCNEINKSIDIEEIIEKVNSKKEITEHCVYCNSMTQKKVYDNLTNDMFNLRVFFFIEFVIADPNNERTVLIGENPIVIHEKEYKVAGAVRYKMKGLTTAHYDYLSIEDDKVTIYDIDVTTEQRDRSRLSIDNIRFLVLKTKE